MAAAGVFTFLEQPVHLPFLPFAICLFKWSNNLTHSGPVPLLCVGGFAYGFIAIGNIAMGLIAIGNLAVGLFSVSTVSISAVAGGGVISVTPLVLLGVLGFSTLGCSRLTLVCLSEIEPAVGIVSVVLLAALSAALFYYGRPLFDRSFVQPVHMQSIASGTARNGYVAVRIKRLDPVRAYMIVTNPGGPDPSKQFLVMAEAANRDALMRQVEQWHNRLGWRRYFYWGRVVAHVSIRDARQDQPPIIESPSGIGYFDPEWVTPGGPDAPGDMPLQFTSLEVPFRFDHHVVDHTPQNLGFLGKWVFMASAFFSACIFAMRMGGMPGAGEWIGF